MQVSYYELFAILFWETFGAVENFYVKIVAGMEEM